MPTGCDKVMFEIYREAGYDRRYRVVYFTELDEHNKEREINRAMAGEHLYDGFLSGSRLADGKAAIEAWLARWNRGESPQLDAFERAMTEYEAPRQGPGA